MSSLIGPDPSRYSDLIGGKMTPNAINGILLSLSWFFMAKLESAITEEGRGSVMYFKLDQRSEQIVSIQSMIIGRYRILSSSGGLQSLTESTDRQTGHWDWDCRA